MGVPRGAAEGRAPGRATVLTDLLATDGRHRGLREPAHRHAPHPWHRLHAGLRDRRGPGAGDGAARRGGARAGLCARGDRSPRPASAAGTGRSDHAVTIDPAGWRRWERLSAEALSLRHASTSSPTALRRQPLAVFPDARGLSRRRDAGAGRRVQPQRDHLRPAAGRPANTARVRIFTPQGGDALRRPSQCRHRLRAGDAGAAAATACCASRRSPAWSRSDRARRRRRRDAGDHRRAAAADARRGACPSSVAACAGIAPWERRDGTSHRPTLASDGGNPVVLTEVTPGALARAAPDIGAFRRVAADHPGALAQPLVALPLSPATARRVRARMFSPLTGAGEDAATGSAATPLAALPAAAVGRRPQGAWDIVQGVEMGRPSLLRTTARRGAGRHPRDGRRRLRAGAGRLGDAVARAARGRSPYDFLKKASAALRWFCSGRSSPRRGRSRSAARQHRCAVPRRPSHPGWAAERTGSAPGRPRPLLPVFDHALPSSRPPGRSPANEQLALTEPAPPLGRRPPHLYMHRTPDVTPRLARAPDIPARCRRRRAERFSPCPSH